MRNIIDKVFTYKDMDYMLLTGKPHELLHRCKGPNKIGRYYLKYYGALPEKDRNIKCEKCQTPEVWHSTYSFKLDNQLMIPLIIPDNKLKNLFCAWCELTVPDELAFPYLLNLSQTITTMCFKCEDRKNEKT